MSDAYFCVFWAEKNAERRTQGAQESNFREARKEFGFDAPPPGAVTLCSYFPRQNAGKHVHVVRAVPASECERAFSGA
jgi:hypothetical protein